MDKRFIFFAFFFLVGIFGFQSEINIVTIYMKCLKEDGSPINYLTEDMVCWIEESSAGKEGYRLLLDDISKQFKILNPDGQPDSTWLSEEIEQYLGAKNMLNKLAVVKPNLDIILDEVNNALVFGGEFNNSYSVWIWKFDSTDTDAAPKELSFIDLVSGEAATKEFMQFLIQGDGEKYRNSRLPQMIRRWIDSGYKNEYQIISFLTDNCVQKNPKGKKSDCTELAEKSDSIFDYNSKGEPKCLTEDLADHDYNLPIHFLVKKVISGSIDYEVWSASFETPATSFYEKYASENNKELAWLTILCFACRVELEEFTYSSVLYSVYACDDRVLCVAIGENRLYSPIILIDRDRRQADYVDSLKNNPTFYKSSIVYDLVREWAKDPSAKYIVKAFGDLSSYSYQGDSVDLTPHLDNTRNLTEGLSFLLKKDGKYYHRDEIKNVSDSWFTNVAPSDTANVWLAQLAALDNGVKLLNKRSKNYTFITSYPQDYLRAWKLDKSGNPIEFAPLKNLYDKTKIENLASSYAKAIKSTPSSFDVHLKKIISEYYKNGNTERKKIRQIYPKNILPISSYSPLKQMDSNSSSVRPTPLEEALKLSKKMQYLIEDASKFYIYDNKLVASNKEVWFNEVKQYSNSWLAWLCLADPSIKTLISRSEIGELKVCLISDKDKKNLWSLKMVGSTKVPSEYQLLNGLDSFGLTNVSIGSYVESIYAMPENVSDEEKEFFIDKADKPGSFKLLDYFKFPISSQQPVLLWRNLDVNKKDLLRIGVNVDHNADKIKLNLVEFADTGGFWKETKFRYNKDWLRGAFKDNMLLENSKYLEVWLGGNKLGLAKSTQVGVFLPPPKRSFGFTQLGEIQKLVDDLAYKPMEKSSNSGPPRIEVFFNSWVSSKWDKEIWRGNPLGYFDRVKYN